MVAIPSDTSNQGHKPEAGVLLASVGYDAGLELLFGDAFNLLILVLALALALALVIVFEGGFLADDFLMFATDEAGLSELSIYGRICCTRSRADAPLPLSRLLCPA